MIINCRTGICNIELSENKPRIGVLVSGGIDSVLLYYLLLKERQITNCKVEIFPIVMFRDEGSKYFARPIIDKVNELFGIKMRAKRFGNETLPLDKQVESAVIQAVNILRLDQVYLGAIKLRPEHTIGFTPVGANQNEIIKTPFIELEKDCVIKMYYDYKIEDLLSYTHSCNRQETSSCGECNGCRERIWGFTQLNKKDPIFL